MDGDRLNVPEDLSTSPGRRWSARAVTTFFLGVLSLTGLIDTLWPLPLPTLLGHEADDDSRMRANAKFVDGTRTRLLEHDLRVRSRVRAALAAPWTWLLYRGFGSVPADMLLGRDDWLFYVNWTVAPHQPTEEMVGLGAATLAALERRLNDRGLRLVVAPIPRKSVLYSEYLPSGIDPRPDIEPAYVRALEARGVAAADLPRVLSEHRDQVMYGKRAYHWAMEAQRYTAEEICRRAGLLVEPQARSTTLTPNGLAPVESNMLEHIGIAPEAARAIAGDERENVYVVKHANGAPVATQPRASSCRIVVVGSSFVAATALGPLLHHYADVPVRNAGLGGVDPVLALHEFLAANEFVPEWIVLEANIPTLFQFPPYPAASQVCVDIAPNGVSELSANSALRIESAFGAGDVPLDRRLTPLAFVPRGVLANSGDGVAAIQLEGQVEGAAVEVDIAVENVHFHATWPVDRDELVLPLLAVTASDDAVALSARVAEEGAHATLKLASVRVVAPVDLEHATPLVIDAPIGDAHGWSQRLSLAEPQRVPEQAALVIDLGLVGEFDGSIEVALTGRDVAPARFAGLERNAVIVLNLDVLAGSSMPEIRLSGNGAPPSKLALRALLARPFEREPTADPQAKRRKGK